MELQSHTRSEPGPGPAPVLGPAPAPAPGSVLPGPSLPELAPGPGPWVRCMIAVMLRIGLGVSLMNGGLLGYLRAERGGPGGAYNLAWTTLLGPAAVATVLENDLLVPVVQIALGLALILGFFTVVSSVLAGFLIISGPI